MGEVVVVLNGVEFTTRHNDYKLVKASTTSKGFHDTEDIEFPQVPPEVLNQPDVKVRISFLHTLKLTLFYSIFISCHKW